SSDLVRFAAPRPFQQPRSDAAYLGCNGLHCRPQRRVVAAMLLHEAYSPLTHLGGKFVLFSHDTILSKLSASSKPGALHNEIAFNLQCSQDRRNLSLVLIHPPSPADR